MPIVVNFEHTLEEVNTILTALAKRPYEETADLIAKIRKIGEDAIVKAQTEAGPELAASTEPQPS